MQKSKSSLIPLLNLLEEFYQKEPINYDALFYLFEFGPFNFELYPLGGPWQIARNKEEQQKKLTLYQEHMNTFADFLEEKFYQA